MLRLPALGRLPRQVEQSGAIVECAVKHGECAERGTSSPRRRNCRHFSAAWLIPSAIHRWPDWTSAAIAQRFGG